MSSFIPSLHFDSPQSKLNSEWCKKVIDYYYYNTAHKNLLDGKDVKEIDAYSDGTFSMVPYKKKFKSMKRALKANTPEEAERMDTTGLDWTPLALLPSRLEAAISIVQKIPVEITITAIDPLAAERKQQDINFLKNKGEVEADLQEVASQLSIGKVDLGTTEFADTDYSDSPYGLDLNDPEELDVFKNLIYSLNAESAYETALSSFWELNNSDQIKRMLINDHYRYGVAAHRAFNSPITGLPEEEYIHPSRVEVPDSLLPDFSDNTYRFLHERCTALELFNKFGDEIGGEKELFDMLNGTKDRKGYTQQNGRGIVRAEDWASFKVDLVYVEVKSVDWIGVVEKTKSKIGAKFFTTDEKKATRKIWAQNTYCFYWLKNTDRFFKIERLPFAHRQLGKESFQTFSIDIYRSKKKSAVELAIGENKKAQIADIKMQHAILKSVPTGKYIDLKFLRGALTGLKEGDVQYLIDDLVDLAMEHNIAIGDSEDFDQTRGTGQYTPVGALKGGLSVAEIQGYLTVIADANAKIELITGVNGQLTGQSANPEGLVGMQKLLINSAINALYYVNEAIAQMEQNKIYIWKNGIDEAVKAGGASKKAIEAMVGKKKAKLIDGLTQSKDHQMIVKVGITQREEERNRFEQELFRQKEKGVISAADEFLLRGMSNPKDQFALLAVKEKQFLKRQQQEMQQKMEHEQNIVAQQGQNQQQAVAAQNQGKIEQAYAKADAESKILALSNELQMTKAQQDGLIRRALQQDRTQGQIQKSIETMRAKNDLETQKELQV